MSIDLFIQAFLPFYILVAGIILVLVFDLFIKDNRFGGSITILAMFGAILAAFSITETTFAGGDYFYFGNFFKIFVSIGLSASILVATAGASEFVAKKDLGIFYALLLTSNVGGMLIAASRNYVPLYVGFELVAMPTYAMVAYKNKDRGASEAAMKIFILGALSSAITLFGISFIYGATGTLSFTDTMLSGTSALQIIGVALMIMGVSFEVGLVPFHWWISDVYAGAPISVVNYLAVGSKKMTFAFIFQVFFFAIPGLYKYWAPLFGLLTILTILVGNTLAIIQNRVMRLIAYSSIAQAGYIAMALTGYAYALNSAGQQFALAAGIFHIIAHVAMKGALIIGTFIVVASMGNDHIENFRGVLKKDPVLGGALIVALFSLMGIPPLGGFFGKFFLFMTVVATQTTLGYVLAATLAIGSAISIYYYARLLMIIIADPVSDVPIKPHTPLKVILILLSLFSIFLGIFGQGILGFITQIVL